MFRFIKLNKAKCLACGEILLSPLDRPAEEQVCGCGNLKMSGGSTHLVRNGYNGKTFQELSEINIDDRSCPNIKEDTQDPPPQMK